MDHLQKGFEPNVWDEGQRDMPKTLPISQLTSSLLPITEQSCQCTSNDEPFFLNSGLHNALFWQNLVGWR